MAAPPYAKLQAKVAANFFSATLDPGATAGQVGMPLSTWQFPALSELGFDLGATGSFKFNVIGTKTLALAGATQTVDLSTIPDPFGTVLNMASVSAWLVLNDAAVAGYVLQVGGNATNPWAAPFNGSATAQITVPPGDTNAFGQFCPGFALLGGPRSANFAVTGTSKVIKFDPGANTFQARLLALGLSA
jgi:hypothetical protein